MAYSKNTWNDGDIITASKMNNMEEGINNVDNKAVTSITVGTTKYTPTGGSVQIPAYPSKVSDLKNDSGFITSSDLPTVPTKVSDLENDSNFVTNSKMLEAIANAQLGNGEDSDINLSIYQPIEESTLTTTAKTIPTAINELKSGLDDKVNKEVGKGLSTNDLTNELVTKINSSATEAFVTNAIANAQLGDKEVDLSGYATVDALNLKADLTHTHDQYLTKVPDEYITETELTDKNYADKAYVTQAVKDVKVDLTGYAKTSDIPKKVSDLANDKGYLSSVPSEYVTETELNAKGYLTSHQDISGLQPKTDDSLTTTDKTVIGAINELKTNISNINTGGGSGFSGSYNDLTDKPTIPTKTSDLNNDSGYLSTEDITTTIDSSSTDTQIPTAKAVNDILSTVTGITNVRKVFYGLNELNNAKGTDISLVVGEDNTIKIVDALSPIETFTDYFHNDINSNRFGIGANTYGTDISLLTITKFNDNNATIRAYMSNGKLLIRRYLNGVLEDWQYDKGNSKDVPNTVIVSEDIIINLNSNCYYTVINGVCYVTLWGFTCTGAGQYVVNSSMPKTKLTMKGVCTYGNSGYVGGCAYVLYDGKGNNKLYIEVKSTNEPLYGSFSYPVEV